MGGCCIEGASTIVSGKMSSCNTARLCWRTTQDPSRSSLNRGPALILVAGSVEGFQLIEINHSRLDAGVTPNWAYSTWSCKSLHSTFPVSYTCSSGFSCPTRGLGLLLDKCWFSRGHSKPFECDAIPWLQSFASNLERARQPWLELGMVLRMKLMLGKAGVWLKQVIRQTKFPTKP